MNLNKGKIVKIGIITLILVAIILVGVLLPKNKIKEFAKSKIEEQLKAEVQTDIQKIIDETKTQVQETESREAALSDLKLILKEKGYILDIETGEVEYKNYIITINENLSIASIEEHQTKAYYEIKSSNGENLSILLTIENPNGIEKVIGEDITMEANGKEKIVIDRTIKEGEKYQLRLKINGEEKEELYTLIASTNPNINITNEDALGDGTTKSVEIQYPNNENVVNYYSTDNEETWQEYTGEFNISTTQNFKITAKSIWKQGRTIFNVKSQCIANGDSIISVIGEYIDKEENPIIYVKGEKYNTHVYFLNEDTILTQNTTYGNANDIATQNTDAKNMVIVKAKGNLTINEGVTVGPYYSSYGGPKGFLLYCEETLTNNGTIQNNYGAKAPGQNVYLWKNEDESYEYVPAVGASGATRVSAPGQRSARNGNAGSNANTSTYLSGSEVKRATAGGGGGGAARSEGNFKQDSSTGGTGTSYGGGGGGGGTASKGSVATYIATPNDATTTLGTSGSYQAQWVNAMGVASGGGAGASIGLGVLNAYAASAENGKLGTGGLLIIYAKNLQINNKGQFTSVGADGGNCSSQKYPQVNYNSANAGGGASGGGSINIFIKTINIIDNKIESHINVSGGSRRNSNKWKY